jgi:RNA polymerase sigma-70 factor (ECF subfamily)
MTPSIPDPTQNDRHHVDQLRAHDPSAWSQYLTDLGPAVLSYARGAGHPDPQEVVGAVMETLVRRISEFEGGLTQLRSFAFSVAHARIVDEYRRRNRDQRCERLLSRLSSGTETSGAETSRTGSETYGSGIAHQTSDVILAAIDRLPTLQREAITLRYIKGLTVTETAEATGRTPGAIRVATSRGLRQLRRELIGARITAPDQEARNATP